jgi:nucleotide-binding universal stress UspA family protein
MFQKVVIGVDGRPGGQDAIALARTLAPEAELVLGNVFPFAPTLSRVVSIEYRNFLQAESHALLREARAGAGLTDTRMEALTASSPAKALHRLAQREAADLLVVGSAHHGPVGRALLGDVGRAALHGSPCPVAVAPHGFTGHRPQTIGVAFDGSPEAHVALGLAVAFAAGCGARLQVVGAINFGPLADGAGIDLGDLAEEVRAVHQRRLDETVAGLPVPVQARAVLGYAGPVVGRLAHEVDLLFCGSRGHGPVGRVVLGSTADQLIHAAPCPVVVVPRSAVTAPADPPATPAPATAHD